MPLYLRAPQPTAAGPDGLGWNRLRVDGLAPLDQCAAQPLTAEKYVNESCDTRLAAWGGFAACHHSGQCGSCRRPAGHDLALVGRLMVRIDNAGQPWLMHHPERGWASYGVRTSWTALAQTDSHVPVSRRIDRDEHSRFLWLEPVAQAHTTSV